MQPGMISKASFRIPRAPAGAKERDGLHDSAWVSFCPTTANASTSQNFPKRVRTSGLNIARVRKAVVVCQKPGDDKDPHSEALNQEARA